MNVLCIGNSFSEDATRYLHGIARADGVELQVVNLYIGGCSLERHYRNMLSGERVYELQCNGHRTRFSVSLGEALLNREWDVITIQQASHYSFDFESYTPYISSLAEFVRKCAPKAKIYMHQTWAYEEGSERLARVAGYGSSAGMLADIVSAYAGVQGLYHDTYHMSKGLGRYALGLLWYSVLCGADVLDNSFCDTDTPLSDDEMLLVKKCVEALE